jgi:ATP-binding cassette subfamily C protein
MTKKLYWKDIIYASLHYRSRIIYSNLAILTISLLVLPIPMVIPFVIENYLAPNNPNITVLPIISNLIHGDLNVFLQIVLFLIFVLVLRLLILCLNKFQYKTLSDVSSKVTLSIRKLLMEQIDCMRSNDIKKMGGSLIATKILFDVETINDFLCNLLGKFTLAAVVILFSLAVLLYIHLPLGICIFLLYPIVLVYWAKIAMNFTLVKQQEKEAQETLNKSLSMVYSNVDTIRATASQVYHFDQLREESEHLQRKSIISRYGSYSAMQSSSFILNAGVDIFQFSTLAFALVSGLSLGKVLTIYGYLWLVQNPILEIIYLKNAFYSAKSSLERINTLFSGTSEPHDSNKGIDLSTNGMDIKFHNISFYYSHEKPIFDQFNFEVRQGEFISIGGPSGGGKSSLASLLIGLNYPNKGSIYYGGYTIFDIGAKNLRKQIVCVLQETCLFEKTIRENLVANKRIADKEVLNVLELCQLGSFIKDQEKGLDTLLGGEGISLSGGQKQRMAIARAILLDPKIIIFDESTSALDYETEKKLYSAILPFLKSRTSIIISHRKGTLDLADKTYWLSNGQLASIEVGCQ